MNISSLKKQAEYQFDTYDIMWIIFLGIGGYAGVEMINIFKEYSQLITQTSTLSSGILYTLSKHKSIHIQKDDSLNYMNQGITDDNRNIYIYRIGGMITGNAAAISGYLSGNNEELLAGCIGAFISYICMRSMINFHKRFDLSEITEIDIGDT